MRTASEAYTAQQHTRAMTNAPHEVTNLPALRVEDDSSVLTAAMTGRLKEMGYTDDRGKVILELLIAAQNDAEEWLDDVGEPQSAFALEDQNVEGDWTRSRW